MKLIDTDSLMDGFLLTVNFLLDIFLNNMTCSIMHFALNSMMIFIKCKHSMIFIREHLMIDYISIC